MRTAIVLITIGLGLWAAMTSAQEPAETTQPVSRPAVDDTGLPAEPTVENLPGGVAAEKKVPHGPADPVYHEPAIPNVNPALAVNTVGPFRLRNWPTQAALFADGRITHMLCCSAEVTNRTATIVETGRGLVVQEAP